MKLQKILSLVCCLLMMMAAAICVNKELAGHDITESAEPEAAPSDTMTVAADGSTVIHTKYLTKIDGYAGPVPLDITIDPDGEVTAVTPLPNAETPRFFRRASEILKNWVGKQAGSLDPLATDAISGATFSSEALKINMDAGLSHYLANTGKSGRPTPMPWKMWVALAVTLAACVVPLVVRSRIYLTVQLAANVIVLGFWCGQFLDYTLMLKYLSSGIPLPVGLTAVAMLVAAFIYPLFGKPQHYCNHICPLGSAQILAGMATKHKLKLGAKTVKALDWFRKILWAILMLSLWADILTEWMDLELFQAFMFRSAPTGIIIAAGVFVVLSAVVARPYCRFVCPTGSLIKRAEDID